MTPRARVITGPAVDRAAPVLERGVGEPRRRRMAREELEARLAAERVVQDAYGAAEAILADARARGASAGAAALEEARREADTALAARWVALRQREHEAAGRDADRVIAVAVALAERLLGASLALEPSRIVDVARTVLDEARGARRAVIEAHPLDASELRQRLTGGDLESAVDRGAKRRGACARRTSAAHRPGNHRCPPCPPIRAAHRRPPRRAQVAKPIRPRWPLRPRGAAARLAEERMAVRGDGRERPGHAVGRERADAGRPRARFPVHGRAARHPAGARVRALHRGATAQGRCVPALLHPAADPLAVRDDGGGHSHAVDHPDAAGALRHRRRRSARRPRPRDSAVRVGGGPLAGRVARHVERRAAARRLAAPSLPRSLLRPADPGRDRPDALARRLRGLGGNVRDR